MFFLGTFIKLHIHCLAEDKVCLRWQAYLAWGKLGAMRSIQVYQLICLILPFAHDATCEVQLLMCGCCAPYHPHGLILLNINKHSLELQMCLWYDLKQGTQSQCDPHDNILGKCCELAYLPGALCSAFSSSRIWISSFSNGSKHWL